MKIFVTGATGYIGRKLIEELLDRGNHVVALCRRASDASLFRHPRISIYEGDLSDSRHLQAGLVGCEQCYHLAAYAKVWAADMSIYRKVNVDGTRNLLEAAQNTGVKRFVFTSTAGVMGPSKDLEPVAEDTRRQQAFFNDYERTKAEAESVCGEYVERGLALMIVNPSRVYGPGAATESNAISRLITLLLKGKWRIIPGNGTGLGNYVFVDDVVRGHIAAMNHGQPGERYILGGENVSYDDFFRLLKRLTGAHSRLYHIPLPLMVAFARVELFKAQVLGISPLITPEWVRKYLYHWPLSSQKAQQQLGYTITPLEEGLGKTIEALQAKNSWVPSMH